MTLLSDAFTAYLGPLLKKHEAGDYIIWEDLESSYSATKEVLKTSDNFFVSKRVEDMHKSQVQAYREAATKALREWAQVSVPLQPMEENDTEEKYVQRCVEALQAAQRPNWKVDSASMIVTNEIRKRAKEIYAKYQPSPSTEEGEDGEEEEEEESGEDDEDGEVEEDGEVGNENKSPSESTSSGTKPKAKAGAGAGAGAGAKKNQKGKGKAAPRKKGTTAKGGNNTAARAQGRKGGAANRGRRNARGGNAKGGN